MTINAFEASFDRAGNSLMTDFKGKPLEAGEVVSLRDLVRGMMYHSGNDAAHAIARYVAQAYYGPAADWPTFGAMMNTHAAALGQAHTQLDNPAGWDRGVHQTTARELAQEFQHGLQDPYFAQVVGFSGTNVATTQGPNGPKTYLLGWGNGYRGWKGEKGGSTPMCNGQAAGCAVRAATRIGRRVVIARTGAGRVVVTVTVDDAVLKVEVADDGTGGADPEGEGLRGLVDRVEALAGSLELESPVGGGTRVTARLPLQ